MVVNDHHGAQCRGKLHHVPVRQEFGACLSSWLHLLCRSARARNLSHQQIVHTMFRLNESARGAWTLQSWFMTENAVR